jgi:CrcB protein
MTSIDLVRFPLATLFVNLIGAFVIGVVAQNVSKDGRWYYALSPGFCGGFTTFSTFCFEIQAMIRDKFYIEAVLYIIVSVFFGVLFAFLGGLIQRKEQRRTRVTGSGGEQSDMSDLSLRLSEHAEPHIAIPSPVAIEDAS